MPVIEEGSSSVRVGRLVGIEPVSVSESESKPDVASPEVVDSVGSVTLPDDAKVPERLTESEVAPQVGVNVSEFRDVCVSEPSVLVEPVVSGPAIPDVTVAGSLMDQVSKDSLEVLSPVEAVPVVIKPDPDTEPGHSELLPSVGPEFVVAVVDSWPSELVTSVKASVFEVGLVVQSSVEPLVSESVLEFETTVLEDDAVEVKTAEVFPMEFVVKITIPEVVVGTSVEESVDSSLPLPLRVSVLDLDRAVVVSVDPWPSESVMEAGIVPPDEAPVEEVSLENSSNFVVLE